MEKSSLGNSPLTSIASWLSRLRRLWEKLLLEEHRLEFVGVLFSRAILFSVLYWGGAALQTQGVLRLLIYGYGISTVLFLGVFTVFMRRQGRFPHNLLFLQCLIEIPVETAMIWAGGGYLSDYGLLYVLTIITGGLFHSVSGVFTLASLAALCYGAIGLVHIGLVPNLRGHLTEIPPDWVQIRFFLSTTLYYAIALLSAQTSRRVIEVRRRLEGTERALDIQEFRFGNMLHELPSGILFFDAALQLQYWNQVASDWLRAPFRQGLTIETALAGLLEPSEVAQLRNDGPTFPYTEMDLIGPGERPLHIQFKPLLRDGKFQGCVFILMDFTRERRWEKALLHQERMAAFGRLAARIAHEIRNPLASISGSAQMLQDLQGLTGQDEKLLRLIVAESNRLNHLLSDLLGYVRERKPSPRSTLLKKLLGDLALALEKHPRYLGGQISVKVEVSDSALTVHTDADLLHQVLLNLGLNALDALSEKVGIVAFTAMQAGSEVVLTVSDNGPGMSEEVRLHAFEPFFTTKPDGTGLGLATCLHDVQLLGGNVTLASAPGVGTTVTIRLPINAIGGESDRHGNQAARIWKVVDTRY